MASTGEESNPPRHESNNTTPTRIPTPSRFTQPAPMSTKNYGPNTIPYILPHERVFPVQIGSELFKLSGASISSDAPSYFSQYFLCQLNNAQETGEDLSTAIRTLYIDRDPATFRDISLHLQGYHVTPRDGTHFVRLFADAQFYSLPKLISQLFEESIFISIGHREFQIPRDIFSDPGNTPNFFSVGFAFLFSTPDDLFPGLDRGALIRPPSILPPSVPTRSADIFTELLHYLRGYPVDIRSESHRAALLRDCRYFNFKGLEQKLIPHRIAYNQSRRRNETFLRLEDIFKSGISLSDEESLPSSVTGVSFSDVGRWVKYARPYVDDQPADLVLEIGDESTRLSFTPGAATHAQFFRDARSRIGRLLEVVAAKLNFPLTSERAPENMPLGADHLKVIVGSEAHIILDGEAYVPEREDATDFVPRKKRRLDASTEESNDGVETRTDNANNGAKSSSDWIVRTGQWRLRLQKSPDPESRCECLLIAAKLDAYTCESARNAVEGFLT